MGPQAIRLIADLIGLKINEAVLSSTCLPAAQPPLTHVSLVIPRGCHAPGPIKWARSIIPASTDIQVPKHTHVINQGSSLRLETGLARGSWPRGRPNSREAELEPRSRIGASPSRVPSSNAMTRFPWTESSSYSGDRGLIRYPAEDMPGIALNILPVRYCRQIRQHKGREITDDSYRSLVL